MINMQSIFKYLFESAVFNKKKKSAIILNSYIVFSSLKMYLATEWIVHSAVIYEQWTYYNKIWFVILI